MLFNSFVFLVFALTFFLVWPLARRRPQARWILLTVASFIFRPPSTREMVALETELSGFDESAFVSAFETAGGTWLAFPPDGYHSYDSGHLRDDAAVQFSKDFARRLQDS